MSLGKRLRAKARVLIRTRVTYCRLFFPAEKLEAATASWGTISFASKQSGLLSNREHKHH